MTKHKRYLYSEVTESVHIALASLAANKMRAMLTMLGIIIGVAAVITMVALGAGAQKAVADRIQSMGSNLLFINPGSSRSGHVNFGMGSSIKLKNEDLQALQEKCNYAAAVIPELSRNAQLQWNGKNWNCSVVGTMPEYESVRNTTTTQGRYFTNEELETFQRVAVIGSDVQANLFEDKSPLGEVIRVNKDNFVVIGILEKKGQSGWRNNDDQIIIPITTAQKRLFGADYLTGITVKVLNDETTDAAFLQVEKILRRQHRLNRDQDNDFSIRNQSDLISTFQETNRAFGFLLAAIAGVSLLVGGIGIMNIMLVSVTERTREIGIRKAIGARRNDILLQFLVESIALSISGGVVGILLGMFFSYALSAWAQWNTMISIASIFMSFGFATAVGLFFGIYPARKAASLDPIIALRYE
jgi:putative ABC transport system permease protein